MLRRVPFHSLDDPAVLRHADEEAGSMTVARFRALATR
jgi:hypothetical protein